MNIKYLIILALFSIPLSGGALGLGEGKDKVVVNPINLNYMFQPKDNDEPRREAADPCAEFFKGYCYMFASKSSGYWRSKDMVVWDYIAATSIPIINDYAPTVMIMNGEMYLTTSSDDRPTRIFRTSTPEDGNSWKEVDLDQSIRNCHQHDPCLFLDDDGRVYFYYGCSDKDPIVGMELDPKNKFKIVSDIKVLIEHHQKEYGWEQQGADNETGNPGWNEGPAMIKVNGKYYLQYAGNGTQFRTYADGCYVSDNPLGPFKYVEDSPFCLKPNGFIGAAGHGHTFKDPDGNYWHVASMIVGVRHMFERRLGLFPVIVDDCGLHAMTAMTDYPWMIPDKKLKRLDFSPLSCGWRLLRATSVRASSSMDNHIPALVADNKIETWWASSTGEVGEWLCLDLGSVKKVEAIHVNFADEGIVTYTNNVIYRYTIEGSKDGNKWFVLVDMSNNITDAPHKLILLDKTKRVRYVRITNRGELPGKFSVMDLRVFGEDNRGKLGKVKGFRVERDKSDPRMISFEWQPVKNADGYLLSWGLSPNHLTHSVTVDSTRYHARYFNRDSKYYFDLKPF